MCHGLADRDICCGWGHRLLDAPITLMLAKFYAQAPGFVLATPELSVE